MELEGHQPGEFGPEADRARGDADTSGAELPVPAARPPGCVTSRMSLHWRGGDSAGG